MPAQRVDQFIGGKQERWGELERLLHAVQGGNLRALSADELERLNQLYRQATADLALANRDYPRDPVAAYLNRLVAQAHAVVYYREGFDWQRIVRFIITGFPRLYRATFIYTLLSFFLFAVPAVIAFCLTAFVSEESAVTMLGADSAYQVIEYFRRGDIWTRIPLEVRPEAAAQIMTNNIRVIFIALAGGMTFGLLTLYVAIFNGISLGAICGLAFKYGMLTDLLSFVSGHGVIELSVIFLGGGVGLMMGDALLRPGQRSRSESLSLVAPQAGRLVVGGALLLVIAGLIEGFFSPAYSIPPLYHYLFGAFTGVVLYLYLGLAGRERKAKETVDANVAARPDRPQLPDAAGGVGLPLPAANPRLPASASGERLRCCRGWTCDAPARPIQYHGGGLRARRRQPPGSRGERAAGGAEGAELLSPRPRLGDLARVG